MLEEKHMHGYKVHEAIYQNVKFMAPKSGVQNSRWEYMDPTVKIH